MKTHFPPYLRRSGWFLLPGLFALIVLHLAAPAQGQFVTDLDVVERDGVPYVDLEQLTDALGVRMDYDDVFNQATVGRGNDDVFVFMPGFESFRYRGKIESWDAMPVRSDGRILVPLSMAQDLIIPEFSNGARPVQPNRTPTPAASTGTTPTPTWSEFGYLFGLTPEPTRPEIVAPGPPLPPGDATGLEDLPPRPPRTPFPTEGAAPTPTPFRVASVIRTQQPDMGGDPETVDGVFLDLVALDEDAASFLQAIRGPLVSRLRNEARVNVILPEPVDGERPTETALAAQANASGADVILSLRVAMTEQPISYAVYHYSPLVAAMPPRPNADSRFGQKWGLPDENRAQLSASFAEDLVRHFTGRLEETGLGVRQGRLELLQGAQMPGVLVDFRMDRLLSGRLPTHENLIDALVFSVIDIKNQMEGRPAVAHDE